MTDWAARDAYHELLDLLRDADRTFVEGDRALTDEVSVAEGYRYLTDALHAAMEIYLRSDAQRPAFVPIVGPTFKWGGDNSDAFYNFAPVSPDVEYVVHGKRGDAVYISVCVYGGPDDGRWSTRIVSNINDRDITSTPTAASRSSVARERPADARNWLAARRRRERDDHPRLPRRSRCTVRRRVYDDRDDPGAAAAARRSSDAEVAGRLRSVTNFLRELLAITPLPDPAAPNTIADVWAVPDATYGWAAKDAHYAMGSFELADDEQLVIEGRSPECAYWGCMLWNPFMQTFDYRYQRIGINGEQATYEPDGSWRLVVAARDPGHPNWLSTAGHRTRRAVLPLVPRGGDAGDARSLASNARSAARRARVALVAAAGRGVAVDVHRRRAPTRGWRAAARSAGRRSARARRARASAPPPRSRRSPSSVSTAFDPRRSEGHCRRSTSPARTRPSIRRVIPLGERCSRPARSVIRSECSGSSERCTSTSYSPSERPCSAWSSPSSVASTPVVTSIRARQARISGSESQRGSRLAARPCAEIVPRRKNFACATQ